MNVYMYWAFSQQTNKDAISTVNQYTFSVTYLKLWNNRQALTIHWPTILALSESTGVQLVAGSCLLMHIRSVYVRDQVDIRSKVKSTLFNQIYKHEHWIVHTNTTQSTRKALMLLERTLFTSWLLTTTRFLTAAPTASTGPPRSGTILPCSASSWRITSWDTCVCVCVCVYLLS